MSRVLARLALLALSLSALSASSAPSRVLFPQNLHLTRAIDDPVTGATITIEEYCFGNRMVAVTETKTVIVDYEKQEITEIDRKAGTYSLSRFDELANATEEASGGRRAAKFTTDASGSTAPRREWTLTPLGARGGANGRTLESFEFVDTGVVRRKVGVGVDRSVSLSREAVEVLIGAAYPSRVREEHEPVLRAAGSRTAAREIASNSTDASAEAVYGLPVSQEFTYSESGVDVTFRSTITRIGNEAIPAELLMIPPTARRVESKAAAMRRELRELDFPTTATPPEN